MVSAQGRRAPGGPSPRPRSLRPPRSAAGGVGARSRVAAQTSQARPAGRGTGQGRPQAVRSGPGWAVAPGRGRCFETGGFSEGVSRPVGSGVREGLRTPPNEVGHPRPDRGPRAGERRAGSGACGGPEAQGGLGTHPELASPPPLYLAVSCRPRAFSCVGNASRRGRRGALAGPGLWPRGRQFFSAISRDSLT